MLRRKKNTTPEGDGGDKGVWSIHNYQKVSLESVFFQIDIKGCCVGDGLHGDVREGAPQLGKLNKGKFLGGGKSCGRNEEFKIVS